MLEIIHETDDLLVINKPPHLLVHPTKPGGPITLWDQLKELLAFERANGGQVSLVHRLDRETSGIILVAKNYESARTYAMALERGAFKKEYQAIVVGWVKEDRGAIDAPLLRKGEVVPTKVWLQRAVHPTGAPAITDFQVEQRWQHPQHGPLSLLSCWPRTGRTHQIRVHLAHLGHPIVGDKIYGPSEEYYLDFIEKGWTPALEKKLWLSRHALHARALEVTLHDKKESWQAPLPEDLKSLCNTSRSLNYEGAF
ncbi:MAG: RluA family pseudouridine synthase [Verrucomicrobia bacterium]|nr:RluA family pseudouridine synthase [Verrucomicrobiota bacterium]